MDKYEAEIKIKEIEKLYHNSKYKEAAQLGDEINWAKIKSWEPLAMMIDVYENVGRGADAKDVAIMAYNRKLGGIKLVYRLAEILIRLGDLEEAQIVYNKYCVMAKNRSDKYILRYHLLKARKASDDELISALEDYVKIEVDEAYMYKLAKLYAKKGELKKCEDVCNSISSMFVDNKYAKVAAKLKQNVGGVLTERERQVLGGRSASEEDLLKTAKLSFEEQLAIARAAQERTQDDSYEPEEIIEEVKEDVKEEKVSSKEDKVKEDVKEEKVSSKEDKIKEDVKEEKVSSKEDKIKEGVKEKKVSSKEDKIKEGVKEKKVSSKDDKVKEDFKEEKEERFKFKEDKVKKEKKKEKKKGFFSSLFARKEEPKEKVLDEEKDSIAQYEDALMKNSQRFYEYSTRLGVDIDDSDVEFTAENSPDTEKSIPIGKNIEEAIEKAVEKESLRQDEFVEPEPVKDSAEEFTEPETETGEKVAGNQTELNSVTEINSVTEEISASEENPIHEEALKATVEESPATEESPVIEEPPVTEETPDFEEISVYEKAIAAAVEESVRMQIEENQATEKMSAAEESPATEEPPAAEEPSATEELPATEEAAETEEPSATEEPLATEEATETEEPPAVEEPLATEEYFYEPESNDIEPEPEPVEKELSWREKRKQEKAKKAKRKLDNVASEKISDNAWAANDIEDFGDEPDEDFTQEFSFDSEMPKANEQYEIKTPTEPPNDESFEDIMTSGEKINIVTEETQKAEGFNNNMRNFDDFDLEDRITSQTESEIKMKDSIEKSMPKMNTIEIEDDEDAQIEGQIDLKDWLTESRIQKYEKQSTKEFSKSELERILDEKDEKSRAYDKLMEEHKKKAKEEGKPFNVAVAKQKVEEQMVADSVRTDMAMRTGMATAKLESKFNEEKKKAEEERAAKEFQAIEAAKAQEERIRKEAEEKAAAERAAAEKEAEEKAAAEREAAEKEAAEKDTNELIRFLQRINKSGDSGNIPNDVRNAADVIMSFISNQGIDVQAAEPDTEEDVSVEDINVENYESSKSTEKDESAKSNKGKAVAAAAAAAGVGAATAAVLGNQSAMAAEPDEVVSDNAIEEDPDMANIPESFSGDQEMGYGPEPFSDESLKSATTESVGEINEIPDGPEPFAEEPAAEIIEEAVKVEEPAAEVVEDAVGAEAPATFDEEAAAEEVAAEKAAAEKAAAEKEAAEKAAAEKEAAEKAAAEKAAAEKEAAEKAAAEKAAAEKAAAEKAAAKEAAKAEKHAKEVAKEAAKREKAAKKKEAKEQHVKEKVAKDSQTAFVPKEKSDSVVPGEEKINVVVPFEDEITQEAPKAETTAKSETAELSGILSSYLGGEGFRDDGVDIDPGTGQEDISLYDKNAKKIDEKVDFDAFDDEDPFLQKAAQTIKKGGELKPEKEPEVKLPNAEDEVKQNMDPNASLRHTAPVDVKEMISNDKFFSDISPEEIDEIIDDKEVKAVEKIMSEEAAVDRITARITGIYDKPIITDEIMEQFGIKDDDEEEKPAVADETEKVSDNTEELVEKAVAKGVEGAIEDTLIDTVAGGGVGVDGGNVILLDERVKSKAIDGFDNYSDLPGIIPGLSTAFESLQSESLITDSSVGNFVVYSDEDIDTFTFCKILSKSLNIILSDKKRKVIKTNANKLNSHGFAKNISKISSSILIIEDAEELNTETASDLMNILRSDESKRMFVILEGTKSNVEEMMRNNAGMNDAFNHQIELRFNNVEELLEMTKSMATSNGYKISERVEGLIAKEIEAVREKYKEVTERDISQFVNDAIKSAKKRAKKNRKNPSFDPTILVDEDFR